MRTIKHSGVHELEIRRSRFICALARVVTEDDAHAFIAERRRTHRDATHSCTAYVLGEHGEITRNSDDGEPAGTAGLPMLEVLARRGLTGVTAVVTRYFGGVKLGAGGLVRAYGQAVAETIDAVGMVERRPVVTVTVTVGHERAGRLQRDLHASPYPPTGARYGPRAEMDVAVPEAELAVFEAWVAAATGGQASLRRGARTLVDTDL
ncbi:YigZ family protein [Actinoallomurus purpureus]|uniref:YigZ family protein n=1 Tax=Actinoallomurus purpureus TaxID=478114 RepID=UPI002093D854|nr:YigZ family protein [Actinoallomurus purpureus]MCO6004119.1 YigZ family protein [Actinoallomurus purpureus]